MTLYPVILSGGSGSRLWPLSREHYPKPLLPLISGKSLLQETATRVDGLPGLGDAVYVCNEEHRFLLAEQVAQLGRKPATIILEPDWNSGIFLLRAGRQGNRQPAENARPRRIQGTPSCLAAVGILRGHRQRTPFPGEAPVGQTRRHPVAADAPPSRRALGGGQGHCTRHLRRPDLQSARE